MEVRGKGRQDVVDRGGEVGTAGRWEGIRGRWGVGEGGERGGI